MKIAELDTKGLLNKWERVLDHDALPEIKDPYRKAVTAVLLENQETASKEEARQNSFLLNEAAPTNSTGNAINNYDPILISMIRRSLPNLISFDVMGVQPMTGPTGLIFAMKSRYTSQSETEALFNEANTTFSANGSGSLHTGNNAVSATALTANTAFITGVGISTALGEALGDSVTNAFPEMAFSIDKVTVTAKTRALQAEYSMELAQDLKAIHGLEAETELANMISTEILAEINREAIRTIYRSATLGCIAGTTTAGTFDLDTDSNGRWLVEKFKGLVFQMDREANAIAKATRRGRGNILIVSSDVASALVAAGVLDYTPALSVNLQVDDTGATFAGVLGGRIKVYIDPYHGGTNQGDELACLGYKGVNPYDAGLFYCPYVPLQMVRAVDPNSFQPKIGFKTRYGMVANPFATDAGDGVVGNRQSATTTQGDQANKYYRIFRVRNLT